MFDCPRHQMRGLAFCLCDSRRSGFPTGMMFNHRNGPPPPPSFGPSPGPPVMVQYRRASSKKKANARRGLMSWMARSKLVGKKVHKESFSSFTNHSNHKKHHLKPNLAGSQIKYLEGTTAINERTEEVVDS